MTAQDAKKMRAAQGKDYGDIDEMMSVQDGVRIPSLQDLPEKKRKDWLLIRTLAVALAPGDCRVLSGKTRELQGPPSFPYVPCGDCCGIVTEIPEGEEYFRVGDRVAARFVDGPRGALGEYALVNQGVCDRVPSDISSNDAAALIGASPAVMLASRIKEGERVLVLGAGGGIGSHVCQLMRSVQKASFIVGVSKDTERLLSEPISCDKAIDYTKEDPWSIKEWKKNRFDVVIDLAGGGWLKILDESAGKSPMIVKTASQGGRYLTLTPDKPIFEAHSIWGALKIFLFPPLWRAIKSRTCARRIVPKYTFAMSLDTKREVATKTMSLASEGKLKACIDKIHDFTTAGVRAAFRRQDSRHPNGKVVVQIAKE